MLLDSILPAKYKFSLFKLLYDFLRVCFFVSFLRHYIVKEASKLVFIDRRFQPESVVVKKLLSELSIVSLRHL